MALSKSLHVSSHRSSSTPLWTALGPQRRCAARRAQVCPPVAVGWDPEGILAAPKGDHIGRRALQRQMADDKELEAKAQVEREKARLALQEERDARVQPSSHPELLKYFLATERAEMEYEAARCRPLLTPEFFSYLSGEIGVEKFSANPRQDRLEDMESLKGFLEVAVEGLDATLKQTLTPVEKMKRLLGSPDKKAALLEMAGNNEIDQPLLDLLQRNIEAAKLAGQAEPALFMEKVRTAAQRFVMS